MKKSAKQKLENVLKWEKAKVEKAVSQVILSQAVPIAEMMIKSALENENIDAAEKLLNRALGKPKEAMEITTTFSLIALSEQLEERRKLLKQAPEIIPAQVIREIHAEPGN